MDTYASMPHPGERAASRRVGHRRDAERVCGVRAKSPIDLAVWAHDLDHVAASASPPSPRRWRYTIRA
eukprot:5674687-Prymnesium_polylepis.1